MRWFEIVGFEGRYEMTDDGMHVRSCPRKWRTGVSDTRVVKSKMMTKHKNGTFQLSKRNGVRKVFYPSELLVLKGKEVSA